MRRTSWVLATSILVAASLLWTADAPTQAQAQGTPPFAGTGHGMFFNASGAPVELTLERAVQAQRWYRGLLLGKLAASDRRIVLAQEVQLRQNLPLQGQEALIANQRVLDAMVLRLPAGAVDHRQLGVIRLLSYRLQTVIGDKNFTRFTPSAALARQLDRVTLAPRRLPGGVAALATLNSGQAYINECANNRVPIPPPINQMDVNGLTGWKIEGEIPTASQFIVNTPAEVRVFTNADGMCIALPRYTGAGKTRVLLDGVICQSKITSKVCFWDNQMGGAGFEFNATDRIPIGVPNIAIDPLGRYQAGGNELLGGDGGVCTGCHAGENAYIVHPEVTLTAVTTGTSNVVWETMASRYPMFAPQRYDPIVPAAWPQNQLSHSPTYVPADCKGCHQQGASGGRLPHLSTELRDGPNYCGSVLTPAVFRTMPQFAGGTLANDPSVTAFRADCNLAPTAGPSDRGDPHIVTTNNVAYDFHAAGEFVALRNSATGFEVQTRQTPVLTGFRAGPNAHTGLDGCVSVNSAAAVRVGKRRLSVQPGDRQQRERMILLIDGRPVRLAGGKLDLGNGASVRTSADGAGFDVRSGDGDRVVLTPAFWPSQSVWYLDVDVIGSAAREGVMGVIRNPDWLPSAPNGGRFGPRPAALTDRHVALNRKFADAWRVDAASSLFDYQPGTSTATFTDRDWPSPPGGMCSSANVPAIGDRRSQRKIDARRAKALCAELPLAAARQQCEFDVQVLGDAAIVQNYRRAIANRLAP